MIRSEIRDDSCVGCGTSLNRAEYLERHAVVFAKGEFAGEPGTVIVAECHCGHTTVVPLSVDLRRAA